MIPIEVYRFIAYSYNSNGFTDSWSTMIFNDTEPKYFWRIFEITIELYNEKYKYLYLFLFSFWHYFIDVSSYTSVTFRYKELWRFIWILRMLGR